VDITDRESIERAVNDVVERFGNLKGVVHCAGVIRRRKWSNDMRDSIDDFEKMLRVNTFGTFVVNACVADAINRPRNHPDGKDGRFDFWTTNEERGIIINLSSIAAHGLAGRQLAYGTTKAAVTGMTRTVSDFLGNSGIRVNAISPAIVMTNMIGEHLSAFEKVLQQQAAFPRRPTEPAELTGTVRYLIENEFINGQDLEVTGAWRVVDQRSLEGERDYRTGAYLE
jgi:NAD(P)-dependent dehydrogenase (short-subunit alcohol dehydrogenase family)